MKSRSVYLLILLLFALCLLGANQTESKSSVAGPISTKAHAEMAKEHSEAEKTNFKGDQYTKLGEFYDDNIKGKTEADDSEVLAVVNGKNITQKLVDGYMTSYEIVGEKKSKEEIIEKIATDILLTKEAQEHDITVSDDEVSKVIEDQMKLLKETTTYKEFQNYLSGADITEEEYIKIVTPIYKKLLIQGKYKNEILRREFQEKNSDIQESEFHNAFEEYYQKYKEELFDNAEIEYLD